ncbi:MULTISPECIES: permease [unclassified Frigoribacterium]|uniref:permease n=1 Tax=unclassified Frigoribacterium TaxID=2627005 RepID=UPI0006FC69A4|nr:MULTISPECIES: permease [unclassified Frigoribacterium]KQO47386.1 permease [Frigoribacterium sp. Leaf254]KQT39479.1 permease [Frigoribacterium sp. Leaf415]
MSAPVQERTEHAGHGVGRRARRAPSRVPLLVAGGLVLAVLVAVRLASPLLGPGLLPNALQDFVTLTISVIVESMPFVLLGIVLSIVVQEWLPQAFFSSWLPKRGLPRRAVISFLGMFLPVCECGNVPLARGLVLKGFTVSESMTFLLAAPILNPITIITTHQAFGWDNGILVARLIGGFVIANLIGWLFSKHPNQQSLLTSSFAAECRVDDGHAHGRGRTAKSVDLFRREMSTMMPALFIGAAIAGAIQTIVPRSVLVTLGSNPVWSVLAMMVLAFVISICSNVDAFFVLPFASTFMPGGIAAFLVFGPIIDVKMLALLRTTYTPKVLGQVTLVVALTSAAIGLVVNYVA